MMFFNEANKDSFRNYNIANDFEKAKNDNVFNMKETAKILRVSLNSLKSNIANKIGMKPTMIDGKVYFRKDEIVKFQLHGYANNDDAKFVESIYRK